MSGFALLAIAYPLLAVFAVGALWRTVRMARVPVHLRWELSPVPHEKGKSHYGGSYLEEYEWWTKPRERSLVNELVYMFQEIVFLKSVWEHNRRLWYFSFPFHFGIYLWIASAALFFLGAVLELAGVPGSGWTGLHVLVLALSGAGYALGAFGAIGLLIHRLFDPRLKGSTTWVSLFNLVLLLAVFASGVWALAASDYFGGILDFVRASLTADRSIETPGVLAVHLVLTFLFLAYLPFSQMMHFVAKYFTYHQVRWDDAPMAPGGRLEREVTELLKQPVTWSAPHLKTDGTKNWVDIVSEEAEN